MSRIAKLVENTVGQLTEDRPTISQEDLDQAAATSTQLTQLLQKAGELRTADQTSGIIQASLEELHSSLEAMNTEGGLTVDQFKLAQVALESQAQALEIKPIGLGVSMESFNEGAKLQVSLEELESVIAAVDANHEALAQDQGDCAMELCDLVKTAIPAAAHRLSVVIDRAEHDGADNSDETVPAADISYALANGDTFPADFPAYMQAYVAYGKKLAGPFMSKVGEAASKASEFGNISFESIASFNESATKAFEDNIDPREGLTDEDYEICLPGVGPLFADSESCVGVTGVFQTMDKLAHERQPCNPSEFKPEEGYNPDTIPCLSAEQIVTIGKALHDLAMECDTAQFEDDSCETTQKLDKAIADFTAKFDQADDAVVEGVAGNAQVTAEYLGTMLDMARWTPVYFLSNLINTINAFVVYAERSLSKEPIPVSTVNVSQEGYGIKLRTGMRVKYSGGYGKIVKIFDRPTRYKGEIHHCTKDNPKYEVKSDVGNKLSLHKGSALTPY